jgi:hypothetical protein
MRAAAVTQETSAAGKATSAPSGEKKPDRAKGRRGGYRDGRCPTLRGSVR